MKKLITLIFAAAISCVSAEEWNSIFDGESLKGWKGNPELWTVKDGAITGTTTAAHPLNFNTFLVWQAGALENFELKLKYRIERGNSGIQYRSKLIDPDKFIVGGYQADFEAGTKYSGILYEEKGRGILALRGKQVAIGADGKKKEIGPVGDSKAIQANIKHEDWNDYHIIANGNELEHRINGLTTIKVTDHQVDKRSMKGVLALQIHVGPPMVVQFKDLKLKTLPVEKGAAKPAAPASKGAKAEPSKKGPGKKGPSPKWIWSKDNVKHDTVYFRKAFEVKGKVTKASFSGSCDNGFSAYCNGEHLADASGWERAHAVDLTKRLKPGRNVFAAMGKDSGGIAAFIGKISWTDDAGSHELLTDKSWRVTEKKTAKWETLDFDDQGWAASSEIAPLGAAPWGNIFSGTPAKARKGGAGGITMPEDMTISEGFKVEHLYTVPKGEQGSWVSLAVDPKGRLIASDQGKQGVYRITPGASSESTQVEKLDIKITSAQGMLYAFDSLYFSCNGGPGSGLYRAKSKDGGETYEPVEKLKALQGGGEHGPHAVVLTEDGQGLYIVAGNHTRPPENFDHSRVPSNWGEDLLLPRQPDARGHARTIRAPGGWIARINPEGSQWEIHSSGYRNQYDAALNRFGDLFAYDADMEWDFGTPWYRPTRVCHATSGSEFGWRTGTGKWPSYYPDSLPPAVDIGPGCPTGVISGLGAKFPHKYQDAIYVLDWTFGTIYAIHLKEDGASYTAEKEAWIMGVPLAVTDAVIGLDGAMYFTVGGRGGQSALYRVTHPGSENVSPIGQTGDPAAAKSRDVRRSIEQYHVKKDAAAVPMLIEQLGHADRFIRYAARVALEHQDGASWMSQVLQLKNTEAAINGAIAVSRQGTAEQQAAVLASLNRIDPGSLSIDQLKSLCRAYALCFIRMGKPGIDVAEQVAGRLEPLYPHKDPFVNREISKVLVFLDSPPVIEKTLALMKSDGKEILPVDDWNDIADRNQGYGNSVKAVLANQPDLQQVHHALVLRNMKYGWTIPQRREYFAWFNRAKDWKGGNSYQGFLSNIRKDALANANEAERAAVADLTGEKLKQTLDLTNLPQAKGPGQAWSAATATAALNSRHTGRNFENGRNMFKAGLCVGCHRFSGEGGATGPDLTSVASRFSLQDLIESIQEPNKVVSDQYMTVTITKNDGSTVTGQIVSESADHLQVQSNPLAPDQLTQVAVADIKSQAQNPYSVMPPGMINGMNAEELADLMAYLMSRGNPAYKAFQK